MSDKLLRDQGTLLVRVSRELVDEMLGQESPPVVLVGISEHDDGTYDMTFCYPDEQREAALQAAVDDAHSALSSSQYVGGLSEGEAWKVAMDALGLVVTEHKGQAA